MSRDERGFITLNKFYKQKAGPKLHIVQFVQQLQAQLQHQLRSKSLNSDISKIAVFTCTIFCHCAHIEAVVHHAGEDTVVSTLQVGGDAGSEGSIEWILQNKS